MMPHFSFWSWPREFIGSIDDVLAKIDLIEDHTTWQEKIDKVVWRGTGWFSSVGNPDLRWKLLRTTKDKPWADTEVMKWETYAEKASNSIRIENFCKYKYIIYTEVSRSFLTLFCRTDLDAIGCHILRSSSVPPSM